MRGSPSCAVFLFLLKNTHPINIYYKKQGIYVMMREPFWRGEYNNEIVIE